MPQSLLFLLVLGLTISPLNSQSQDPGPWTGKARFVVKTPSGEPCSGATVSILGQELMAAPEYYAQSLTRGSGTCDNVGQCSFTFVRLGKSLWGYGVAQWDDSRGMVDYAAIEMNEAANQATTIVVRPAPRARFRIKRPDGTPVRGASVRHVDSPIGSEVETDEDGLCRVDLARAAPADGKGVRMDVNGRVVSATMSDSVADTFDLTVDSGCDVKVVWQDGPSQRPVHVMLVPALSYDLESLYSARKKWCTKSEVWFSDVEPGTYYVVAEVEGGRPSFEVARIASTGRSNPGNAVIVRVTTPESAIVASVEFLDASGLPIPDTEFRVQTSYAKSMATHIPWRKLLSTRFAAERRATQRTDRLGRIAISIWPDVRGNLRVEWPHGRIGPESSILGGTAFDEQTPLDNLKVRLLLQHLASGVATNADGTPFPHALVRLCTMAGDPMEDIVVSHWWESRADSEGRFHMYYPLSLSRGTLLGFRDGTPVAFSIGDRKIRVPVSKD